ncbi:MAG: lysophospholipase [Anaerolineae bacterium]|nr:lysophospholipase [Anaerolineae bacterium]
MELEVLSRQATGQAKATPILFVHGAWHGAWCWEEYFLPYFAGQGYSSYALSLRGHGGSGKNKALRWMRAADYVADVRQIAESITPHPILIAHSMGGYVVQKYLEQYPAPAGVLMASIPRWGSLPFTLRQMIRHPLMMLRAFGTLSLYPIVDTPEKAKREFFSADMPDEKVRGYAARLQDEAFLMALDSGLLHLPRPKRVKTPLLVLAAANDKVFSLGEEQATARAYGTEAVIFPNMAHDMMLEAGWQSVAEHIVGWLGGRGL